jgi:hypothetical protein
MSTNTKEGQRRAAAFERATISATAQDVKKGDKIRLIYTSKNTKLQQGDAGVVRDRGR